MLRKFRSSLFILRPFPTIGALCMFDNLQQKLSEGLNKVTGKSRLNENNIKGALKDVRAALLEADVALPVVKDFITTTRMRAMGTEVKKSLSPGQTFLKIVRQELELVMGRANEGLDLRARPPAVVLMAGLQGAGKTTTTGKLARFLKEREKKRVMVVSADVYRPAAIEQLKILADEVGVPAFPTDPGAQPVAIVEQALDEARRMNIEVLLVDTAGRLAVDADMMAEIQALHASLNPIETLFVVDAMTGQDAANTAKAFGEALPLTGVVLTKADGDARGGAALSVKAITGKPIKFMGMGEKTDALEPFHPDRVASRLLGMGDVMSLIEDVERKVDHDKAKKLATKVQKGQSFNLEDFREQIQQMKNMGGVANLLDKLPGAGQLAPGARDAITDKPFEEMEVLINSMTPAERRNPELLNGSRKTRICRGAGKDLAALNRLLKQHKQMGKMMKKMKKGGMAGMARGLGGMLGGGGGMPPRF